VGRLPAHAAAACPSSGAVHHPAQRLRAAGRFLDILIKDLSAPDTIFSVAGIPLNILPLVMGVGMFVQQQMMSVTTDPAQAKMMYLMPVIFTFMFWSFPSALSSTGSPTAS